MAEVKVSDLYITYNLEKGVMLGEDGILYPIVTMYDYEGEETNDIDECVAFIAGRGNVWYACEADPEDIPIQPN